MNDHLDLDDLSALVPAPDLDAQRAAHHRLGELAVPPGALGRLGELGAWLAGVQGACPPRPIDRPRLVVIAGDHGVAQLGVSPWPVGATAALVRALLAGITSAAALARVGGTTVRVADLAVDADLEGEELVRHKVRRGSGRIDVEDALRPDEAARAFRAGMALADAEVDAGADLLVTGHLGVGATTPAGALIGVLTHHDAAAVTGGGGALDDATWIRTCATIRDAMRRTRPRVDEPLALLAGAGGADFAAITGFLLQAAVRRTPVVLDGVVSAAAALVGQRIAHQASGWWLAGHLGPAPAHRIALEQLSLEPLLDYRVGCDDGAGALLAVPVVRAAATALAETATRKDCGLAGY